jgi:hypothetical protein
VLKNRALTVIAASVALLVVSEMGLAHHGVADIDVTKSVTIKGTVTDFQFVNPHVEIYVDVKDDKGNVTNWQVESVSPNGLSRRGWSAHSFKAGDQITVTGSPAKDGSHMLRLNEVIFPNGEKWSSGDDNRY